MPEIFVPENADQVREIVNWAADARESLCIRGHASKIGLGPPVKKDNILDLSRLNGVISYAPEELVLTAKAGTPMSAITALLREHRQHMGFEPPDWGPLFGAGDDRGTIGGILSCNASGPRRFKAGAARDHFLGFAAVNGNGESFSAGGKVVKNVTGYDLPKLYAGAYGRLGVMTEVTIKTLPAPEDSATIVVHDLDDNVALAQLRHAASGALECSGLAHLPACLTGATAQTLFRLEGPMASVTDRHQRLKSHLQGIGATESLGVQAASSLWRRIRDASFFVGDSAPLWRLSVPPSRGAETARRINTGKYYFDWAGGLIWLQSNNIDRVRKAVNEAGGHATLFRAPEAVRRGTPVFEPLAPALAGLEGRVREAFDPSGIFNQPER